MTGVVYFAITPKCVMGGGALNMTLDVGPVSAWLSISLDVFIQFKPFYYTADLSISVGCAISINVWFIHVRISVSVGAALHIQGPNPFGGVSLLFIGSLLGACTDDVYTDCKCRFLLVLIHNPFRWTEPGPASSFSRRVLQNGSDSWPCT